VTYTYVHCDIVINQIRGGKIYVYVEDFSHETEVELPYWTRSTLNPKHVKRYDSMKEFTLFLLEYKCVVRNCLITIDDKI